MTITEQLAEALWGIVESLYDSDEEGFVEHAEPMRKARLALAAYEASKAPGHTDLMVTPESIDAFLEQNPLPKVIPEYRSVGVRDEQEWEEVVGTPWPMPPNERR